MTQQAANGHAHAWAEAAPGVRGPPDVAHGVAELLPTTAADLNQALAASQQQVVAARRQIDLLQKSDELLKQEVNQLAHAVAQARRFAHYDHLTRLPNRSLLLDRFNQARARAVRQHKQVAVLFLDLDGFKGINDVLGHTGGDRLLQQVAARLNASIRTSDTACRYGGDEFVVLLPELECSESAVAAKEKIRAHLAAPYLVGGTRVQVTASIGMAIYPTDGNEFDELICKSDAGMYSDKAGGSAPAQIFVGRPTV